MRGEQTGILGFFVSFDGAYVDFGEDRLEVFLVRRVLGRPLVISCRCGVSRVGGGFVVQSEGSSIGKLRIRKAVVKIAMGTFRRLAAVYEPEVAAVLAMRGIALEDGRVVLDPG